MNNEHQLRRGQKWSIVRAKAEHNGDKITLDWLKSQKSIVDDLKLFDDTLKAKENSTIKTLDKTKKSAKGA